MRLRNFGRRKLAIYSARRSAYVRPDEPLISFTFDDFPQSALRVGGMILRQHGLRGTYYASLGLMDQAIPAGLAFTLTDLQQAVAEGHELGCHTFSHCHAWETASERFEQSILENRQALSELIPGTAFTSLSYPISSPRPAIKRLSAKYFPCCRGGGQKNICGETDRNNLPAFFLEKSAHRPDAIKRIIDANCRKPGWLIFATHDVGPNPTNFGIATGLFEKVVRHALHSGTTVLPVAQAWQKICAQTAPGKS